MSGTDISSAIKASCKACGAAVLTASKSLIRNWPIIPASLLMFIIYSFLNRLLQGSGMAGGMLLGLIQISMLSMYYGWLSSISPTSKLKWSDLMTLDSGIFSDTLNTAFVLFIFLFLLQTFTRGSGAENLILIINLAVAVVLNTLAESIYISRTQGLEAVKSAADFMRRNWIEWLIPWGITLLPAFAGGLGYFAILLATSEPLLPALLPAGLILRYLLGFAPTQMFNGPEYGFLAVFGSLLTTVLVNWLMLFRASYYRWLESGNRRSRGFKYRAG